MVKLELELVWAFVRGPGPGRSDSIIKILRSRTRMELAHFGRVEIQIFFKKADLIRPVVQEFLITL